MTEDDNEADACARRRYWLRNWDNVAAVALGVFIGGWLLIGSVQVFLAVRGEAPASEVPHG